MPIDLPAAERFLHANARLLDRHRHAALDDPSAVPRALTALRAYRNDDGGFGHALEPDVRGPHSEPTGALHALEVLEGLGHPDDALVADVAAWVGGVADEDGGVPFVVPATADFPRGPWMVPSDGGSHLTFAIAGALWAAGHDADWRVRGTAWAWEALEQPDALAAYSLKFAFGFLDAVPDADRATATIERLRSRLDPDGTVPVEGGTEGERLAVLDLSPHPGSRSRALFPDAVVESDLDALEAAQQDDGGWTFDWLAWSPGQSAEWRGLRTLRALTLLREHGRLPEA